MSNRSKLGPFRFAQHLAVFLLVVCGRCRRSASSIVDPRQGPALRLGLVDGAHDHRADRPGPHQGQRRTGREGRQVSLEAISSREEMPGTISAFGTKVDDPRAFPAGTAADVGDGQTLTVNADGTYVFTSPTHSTTRGQRIFSCRRCRRDSPRRTIRGAVLGGHRAVLRQFADRHHPGDHHPDPDRRLRRLCAGLDEDSRAVGCSWRWSSACWSFRCRCR